MSGTVQQNQQDITESEDSEFTRLIDQALSRRQFIAASGSLGLGISMAGFMAASPSAEAATSSLMGFKQVPASGADTVIVPEGYIAEPLISWGDPIFKDAPMFDPSGNAPSSAQERQFGDNTDGMSLFPLAEDRALLAINNEYTNYGYLFSHGGKPLTADEVKKAQAAVGLSVFEIARNNGHWDVVLGSKYNRRITANTAMELTGPAAGHDLMKTAADAEGRTVLGTLNNCANGQTPWGTYLTCEENFNGFFGSDDNFEQTADQKRYGLKSKDRYDWHKFDSRFDLSQNPNEANRFGWVVEIDPMDPQATPKKRTALGRFKHENAALTVNSDGHVVVYLGDDERGEHLYKFVSKQRYDANNASANRELLAEGTLYVARFENQDGELKGKGQWLELTQGKNGLTAENGFADQAEVLTFVRRAATQVGATTMDRPEWVAVHPSGKHVCCTLTNNKHRGKKDNQPVDGVNPRANNKYGQIVRWMPTDGNHVSDSFEWDLYLIAGNPAVHTEGLNAGSGNINADNMFNSPDGIGFDEAGRLWIQTDGKYTDEGDF
ncbi:MAG: PhoX family phosphatase, partial [Motiliproteus sp.]|nr:PhoX family phosphatase [Motiliproteus sp.]